MGTKIEKVGLVGRFLVTGGNDGITINSKILAAFDDEEMPSAQCQDFVVNAINYALEHGFEAEMETM